MKTPMLLFFIAILSSCESMLEETPKSFISPANFYKTEADAEAAIAGAYATNTSETGDIYDNYIMIDLLHADYTIAKGSWTSVGNTDQILDPVQSGRVWSFWNNFYNRINRANTVLENVPQIENMNEAVRTRILAEARFLRAMYYFNLVRDFGPLPLRTTSTSGLDNIAAPRSPVSEVFDLIIGDLQIAEKDLPETVGGKTGRASRWAAKILLSQVYLDREMWSEAAEKALEVINSGQYELVKVQQQEDFYKVFAAETSPEDIMSIHYSPTASTSFINSFHGSGTPYNRGTVWGFTNVPNMNSFLGDGSWDNADLRKSFNLYSSYIDDNGNEVSLLHTAEPVRFKKFIKDENGIAAYSRPLFRYAEAFLIHPEAACMAAGAPTAAALESLNVIRRRAYGYDPHAASPVDYSPGMSKETFRDKVIQERAYEFVLETRRWWDLKRTGTAKAVIEAATGRALIDERLLYPIPQTEIDNNPALTQADQNPGY